MLRSLYIILLAPMAYSTCIPARDCPLGLYCPDGYTCKDSGTGCVDVCYTINPTHQGNGTTGRCEDASTSNDVWFDSSLYEVFVYRKLNRDEMIKNISLIATYAFWNNVSNDDEDFLNNITFRLNSSHFALNSLYSSFDSFQNETTPEIIKEVSIISLSQDLMLGDYNMKVQVIWQNKKLAESDVIIHVVDPLPTTLPTPVTCVQFNSVNYSVSSLDLSLKVTLTLSGLTQSEPFDVFVRAKATLSADSDDFTPGLYRATFEPGTTMATPNEIPILSDALDESIEQFTLELYIPGASYKIGIQAGVLNKATASIKDVSEEFVNVGEDINVPPSMTLIISCSHLISTLVPFNITWSKDKLLATNGSAPNLIISQDKHQLILAPTTTNVGGEVGNRGIYACTICPYNGTCIKRQSHCEICKSPKLRRADPITKRSGLYFGTVQCGGNLCIDLIPTTDIQFTCGLEVAEVENRSITVYKDNTLYKKVGGFSLTEVMIPDSLGTYKTVLNDTCGMDIATSILSLCDPMIVYFDTMVFTGSESSGNITVSMELIRHSSIMSGNITVIVIPSDQSPVSAEGNGVDYTSTSITATFPTGINSTTVNIPVIMDNIVERNETIQLEIYVPVPAKYAVETGNPSKAIAIITDNSICSINFRQSNYIINENNGPVQVELILSNPVSFDFTVIINDQDISATGGVDYNSGPYNVTIPAGETLVLFNVTIIDDNVNEENETFNLIMDTTQALPDRIYFGENLTVMILIEDNDALTVSFDQEAYEFNEENGVAQPLLVLSSPSSMDITVIINSTDSTAIGNVEYTPGPYTVIIPAGVTSVPLNITLLASDAEAVSEFILSIVYSNEAMIGDYSQAVVAIIHSNVLYCNQASGLYFGLSVTWERTPAGKTIQKQCVGNELAGMITRICDVDGNWLSPLVACVRKSFENINDKLRTIKNGSLSEEEKLAKTNTIAMVLANITTPQDDSYFPNELTIAVDVLSGVNIITEKVIGSRHPNDTFFKDTTKALNNLLSSSNEAGWKELQQMSPEVNQRLIQSSENFGKILAQTLNNETSKILETQENIVIKTELTTQESINEGMSVSFPDDSDDLTMFAGQTTRITLPNELLRSAISNLSSVPIVNMVFRNLSSILPNTSNASDPITSVISTQLPNPVTTPDDQPIVLTFKVNDEDGNTEGMIKQCVFYDYGTDGSDIGRWSTQGVEFVDELSNDTIITCYSTHLTSFAVLVSPQDERPPSAEDKALSIISYIGCAISLVFLVISIIILSYLMYGKPPKKRNPILIHLNLCIALALGLVVFLSGIETAVDNEGACKFVAALLQYLFTSAFCWMLCEGVMLYMMLITVFGNKLNHYLFFLALGWGPAIPIVAISVGIAHRHYGTDYYCWIKSDDGAIAAFIAPIGAIILINCVFFMMTLRVIYKNRSGNSKNSSFDQTTAKEILKAGMFLLPLLGMTWIIGILAVNNETQVFAWIFAILNSLQGLFIFIFHVARNKEVVAKFHVAKDRYIFGREGSSIYNRIYGSKRSSGGTAFTKSRESRSSTSEMLPSRSSRKESTYSIDDNDVFTSNELKKNNDPPKQDDPDVIDSNKVQDATVTYNKEEEVKILDNTNGSNDKCETQNEKDEKVETEDNNNNS